MATGSGADGKKNIPITWILAMRCEYDIVFTAWESLPGTIDTCKGISRSRYVVFLFEKWVFGFRSVLLVLLSRIV